MLRSFLTSNIALFILTIVLFVFIPLYPKFPLVNVPGTFVAIRLEDLLIALALGYWVLFVILTKQVKSLINDKLIQALALFFFIGGVSVVSGVFITQTAPPHLSLLHYLRRVELMLLFPLAYTAIKTRRQLMIILASMAIVTFIVTIYAFGQQYFQLPVVSTTNSEFSKGQILFLTPDARVNSTFAGHYDLAIYLLMVLCIITALFFGFKKKFYQAVAAILGAISFVVLVMTAARFSFVAAVGGIALSLILVGKKMFLGLMILVAILAIAYPSQLRDRLVSTVSVNLLDQGERLEATPQPTPVSSDTSAAISGVEATPSADSPEVVQRFVNVAEGEPTDSTELGVYRSLNIRLNVEWPRALNAFYRNIFLGSGYASIGIATDNDLLRALGETGILGTTALSLILFLILVRLFKSFKSHKSDKLLKFYYAGVLSMVIAFCLNGLFIDVFEASKVASLFWLVLGASLGLQNNEKNS